MTERVQGTFQVQNTVFWGSGLRAEAGETCPFVAWHAKLAGQLDCKEHDLPGFLFPARPMLGTAREGVDAHCLVSPSS